MSRVHITFVAEAKPEYGPMLRLACWSIRRRAGALCEAPITVVFNERADLVLADELKSRFGVDSVVRERISTALRFTNKWNCLKVDFRGADWMLFLDCDTAVVSRLDQLAERMSNEPVDFLGSPEITRQAWGLRSIFRKFTGRSDIELDAVAHDWFLSDRLPIFNTGVFAIRTSVVPAFEREIVPMCDRLFASMRGTTWNPVQWAKVQWNRRFWKNPSQHGWMVGSYFPRVHSGQLAVPATLIKLGIPFGLLPHAFNWRDRGVSIGEDQPIRILHYLGSRFPFDRTRMFEGEYFDRFAAGEHPGWRTLVEVVSAYNAEQGTGPVQA